MDHVCRVSPELSPSGLHRQLANELHYLSGLSRSPVAVLDRDPCNILFVSHVWLQRLTDVTNIQ